MGLKPPWSGLESCSGAHRVAAVATVKLKAQAENKFHMYYLGVR
jgi:hypothetical protein